MSSPELGPGDRVDPADPVLSLLERMVPDTPVTGGDVAVATVARIVRRRRRQRRAATALVAASVTVAVAAGSLVLIDRPAADDDLAAGGAPPSAVTSPPGAASTPANTASTTPSEPTPSEPATAGAPAVEPELTPRPTAPPPTTPAEPSATEAAPAEEPTAVAETTETLEAVPPPVVPAGGCASLEVQTPVVLTRRLDLDGDHRRDTLRAHRASRGGERWQAELSSGGFTAPLRLPGDAGVGARRLDLGGDGRGEVLVRGTDRGDGVLVTLAGCELEVVTTADGSASFEVPWPRAGATGLECQGRELRVLRVVRVTGRTSGGRLVPWAQWVSETYEYRSGAMVPGETVDGSARLSRTAVRVTAMTCGEELDS